ncbi:uncharacterized protein N0V89_011607 [Didymosphaeria variabile]|uniref:Heterokaryon incompatibility domain-containing protein n=1 Tax=Didymosphaeria variabile TaxID=1932322 RepID=A0A9W8XBG6_9PLEO|nr:uncharacterized protein N0V89_011607 [Didymosphaeria variabile]KAJ4345475.1 hypothetical protein N0V89_011607 [Didymosphaeria variabile]
MSDSDSSKTPLDSLGIALRVSSDIQNITDYYRRATEGLFDNNGNANDPTPGAVLGSLMLGAVRGFVLEHSTQGQEAMLSLLWSNVESAQKSFREVAEQFEVKIEEVKVANSRWNQVNKDEIRQSANARELYQMVEKLIEARWDVPRFPRVSIPEPTTRSFLEPNTTPWEIFEYARLESPKSTIRLVRMESISESLELPIRITIRTICLEDNVPFATLSYTWGNPFGVFCSEKDRDATPRMDIPIICDGRLLKIGENLYRFLCRWRQALANFDERMREHDAPSELLEASRPPVEFWIDAICINQEDLEEKSQQVSIMGDLYAKSAITWVWLGEHDQFSKDAFGVLQNLAKQSDGANDESLQTLDVDNELLVSSGLPDTNSWKWFAVFALFQRQWFRRSWVVQEAALSSRIIFQCGSLNVPSWMIVSACNSIRRFGFLEKLIVNVGMYEMGPTRFELRIANGPTQRAFLKTSSKGPSELRYYHHREGVELQIARMFSRILRIKTLDSEILMNDKNFLVVKDSNNTFDNVSALLDLWNLSRNTLCGNPKDKVYALASLANRDVYKTSRTVQDRRVLEPDYKKSVCEVYCEAAWFTILTHASLDLLSMAGHTALNNNTHGLPSWIPDLSQSPRFVALNEYLKANPGIDWRASGGVRWEIPAPSMRHGRHLGVQARFMGKIRETDHEEPDFSDNESIKVNFKQILEFSKLLPSTYLGHQDGQARFEVVWRTSIADTINGISPAPSNYAVEFDKLYMEAIKKVLDNRAVGNFGHGELFGTWPSENDELFSTWSIMKDMGRLHDHSALAVAMEEGTNETANFQERSRLNLEKSIPIEKLQLNMVFGPLLYQEGTLVTLTLRSNPSAFDPLGAAGCASTGELFLGQQKYLTSLIVAIYTSWETLWQ